MKLDCGSRVLDLSRPVVMGILNVTPDSFSDGGRLYSNSKPDIDLCLMEAGLMQKAGAAIIDVGGESTRPGSAPVSLQEEMDRVLPVIAAIHARIDVVTSVDTSSPEIITAASKAGVGLINDVRALQREGALAAAAASGLPVCLMHMQGQPSNMQVAPSYIDVVSEVKQFLLGRVDACINAGISRSRILLDPGFGFGKTIEHNLALLRHLDELCVLPYPVVAGLSRKSMAGLLTGRETGDRLAGSLALAQIAISKGVRVLRVHDVAPTVDMINVWCKVCE